MGKIQNRLESLFESVLFNIRFFTLAAVIGSAIASVLMFVKGSLLVLQAIFVFIEEISNVLHRHDTHGMSSLIALLISSVDNYLFATVLLIFSMGLYELFISKIDPASRTSDSRPNWLNITSLDDLKGSLGKVILMILIVAFFEKSLGIEYEDAADLLYLGVGVLLISGALFLTHVNANKHKS
ncbi:MAG: YqhA family protein [Deltaproteobacteria bacterium]|nr:YqhA family protein [Deltaproteobacteria bacterium]